MQRRTDERQHRLLQNIMLFTQKNRNLIALKHQLQNRRIDVKIPCGHDNIPPPRIGLTQQPANIRRRKFTLGKQVAGSVKMYTGLIAVKLLCTGRQPIGLCYFQVMRTRHHHLLHAFDVQRFAVRSRQTLKTRYRMHGFRKQFRLMEIPCEGYGHRHMPPQQRRENFQFLLIKLIESV